MKIVLFAHTPPPFHGQSYMVQQLLSYFGGDARRPGANDAGVQCHHVNARLSDDPSDIRRLRLAKVWFLLKNCGQAIWLRQQHEVNCLFYSPDRHVDRHVARPTFRWKC